jgi:hypothetical protein
LEPVHGGSVSRISLLIYTILRGIYQLGYYRCEIESFMMTGKRKGPPILLRIRKGADEKIEDRDKLGDGNLFGAHVLS